MSPSLIRGVTGCRNLNIWIVRDYVVSKATIRVFDRSLQAFYVIPTTIVAFDSLARVAGIVNLIYPDRFLKAHRISLRVFTPPLSFSVGFELSLHCFLVGTTLMSLLALTDSLL